MSISISKVLGHLTQHLASPRERERERERESERARERERTPDLPPP
jgi:hypothetical protein